MLKEEIKKFFKGEVMDDPEDRALYSRDASIFEVVPEIIVAPKDPEDIKNLVKFVAGEKKKGRRISLTARSAGTDMSGGPLNESIIVDFTKHLNHIREVGEGYAVAEPGVYYRDFEKATLAKGWLLPSYPASKSLCAIGGIVSNNSGGEKTLAYGKTEKYVERLQVVLSNGDAATFKALSPDELKQKMALRNFEGEIYRKLYRLLEDNYEKIQAARPNVSKNSAGYYLWNVWDKKTFDLTKLIVGSQGTLALVTEATFKLIRPKKHSRMAVIYMHGLGPLAEIVNEVLKFYPESFESYDNATLKLALKFFFDLIRLMGIKNIFSFGWHFLPDLWIVLTHGLPKLVLMVELAGDDEEVIVAELQKMKTALARFPVQVRVTDTTEETGMWTIRRESFNLLRHKVKNKHTAPFIDDFIVRPEHLSEFLPELQTILKKYSDKMFATTAGHMGDGNFHIIPLMDFKDKSAIEAIPKAAKEVYDLVLRFKGSITAEHNDGLIRSPFLEQMYGEKIYNLFEKTKDIFDPLGIFNPGKKVHSDMNYALAHIKAKK